MSYLVITPDEVLELEETSSGLGLAAGIGYDFQVAGNFFVTPRLQGAVQYLADHWAPTVGIWMGVVWH